MSEPTGPDQQAGGQDGDGGQNPPPVTDPPPTDPPPEPQPPDDRAKMKAAGFIQVSEDTYVNVRHIESVIAGQAIFLISGRRVPLTRGYEWLGDDLIDAIAAIGG